LVHLAETRECLLLVRRIDEQPSVGAIPFDEIKRKYA
jgi:hypothetical protein